MVNDEKPTFHRSWMWVHPEKYASIRAVLAKHLMGFMPKSSVLLKRMGNLLQGFGEGGKSGRGGPERRKYGKKNSG